MFEKIEMAPRDAILGLTEQFKSDPNPRKINLSVGVYKDAEGNTPVLASVKEAERRLLEAKEAKSYLGMDGLAEYCQAVRELIFGAGSEIASSGRAVTVQTPGGTGALRVAAEFIQTQLGSPRMWVSDPTWANHGNIFAAADQVATYPYYDVKTKGLALDAMLAGLEKASEGDVVLLHGCCHNPTGVDPTPEQWKPIAECIAGKKLLPLVDFAYQGFGSGIEEDAAGARELAARCPEMLVCSSFSKNFGLYCERIGALTAVGLDSGQVQAVLSQLKRVVRRMYSNPPAHGAKIVATILADATLRKQWVGEVQAMRDRIRKMRKLFAETLKAKGLEQDFGFILSQKGMFSFSGLTVEQVRKLRDEHSVYIVENGGRINVAGMTAGNMGALCSAIVEVL